MLENAVYSVISPEGCAAILWHDASYAKNAAAALKMTARDLLELGIIDEVVPEPLGGAHRGPEVMAKVLKEAIVRNLNELRGLSVDRLVGRRYEKYRRMGRWQ
jgi:acetyl-CoA carboxylase carboxyl transferase subunit alpha